MDVERARPAGLRRRRDRARARRRRCARSRRLAGAVPPSGVTGAAFYRGRLFLAGQDAGALQLWSIDVTGATAPVLELELPGRRGRVRGPRRPRRARRGAALAALAVPAGRQAAHLRDRPQRAADLRRRRRRPPAGPRGARARGGRARDAHHRDGDRSLRRARAPRRRALAWPSARRTRSPGRDGTARRDRARSRPGAVRVTATKQRLLAGRAFGGRPRALSGAARRKLLIEGRVCRAWTLTQLGHFSVFGAIPRQRATRQRRPAPTAARSLPLDEAVNAAQRPTGARKRSVQPVTHHREAARTRGVGLTASTDRAMQRHSRQTMNAATSLLSTKRWTLAVVCAATAMLMLDIAVVNTALSRIADDLDTGLSGLQWVVDAYTLALASVVLTAGSLADRFGRRRLFTIGLAVFTAASAACAAVDRHRLPRRRARRAGHRRGGDVRRLAGAAGQRLPGHEGARRRAGRLRRHDRRLVRHRPARRRRADQRPGLAVDLPHQHPDRHLLPVGHARRKVQESRDPGHAARRRARPDRADRRPLPARARPAARQRRRLGQHADRRRVRRRRRGARRLPGHRGALDAPDAPAAACSATRRSRARRSRPSGSRRRSSRSSSTRRSTCSRCSGCRPSRPASSTCPARS